MEDTVPYVNVQVTRGVQRHQKSQIVADITESLVSVLGKNPEHIHIVIQEIDEEDWGFAGVLTDDWKKSQGERPGGASSTRDRR